MESRITALEEEIAHLARTVEELNEVVTRQQGEITRLTSRVQKLMERDAGRDLDAGGTVPQADQKPPHW